MKYTIGEKYINKAFLEPEEMEYLGQIKTTQYNGTLADIRFDVWRRHSYGRPDLFATYNGKFLTRSYDATVEGLLKSIQKMFVYEGAGHKHVFITYGVRLSPEAFREQTKDLLTEEEIEGCILKGCFWPRNKNNGEIKYCPECKAIRQTSCAACGCGSCESCGHRWVCTPMMLDDKWPSAFSGICPPLKINNDDKDTDTFPTNLL